MKIQIIKNKFDILTNKNIFDDYFISFVIEKDNFSILNLKIEYMDEPGKLIKDVNKEDFGSNEQPEIKNRSKSNDNFEKRVAKSVSSDKTTTKIPSDLKDCLNLICNKIHLDLTSRSWKIFRINKFLSFLIFINPSSKFNLNKEENSPIINSEYNSPSSKITISSNILSSVSHEKIRKNLVKKFPSITYKKIEGRDSSHLLKRNQFLETKINLIDSENKRILDEVTSLTQKITELSTINLERTKINKKLFEEKEKLLKENEAVSIKIGELSNENEKYYDEKNKLAKKSFLLSRVNTNLSNENTNLSNENTNLSNENSMLKKKIEELLKENTKLLEETFDHSIENDNISKDRQKLSKEKEELIRKNLELSKEKEELMRENTQLLNMNTELSNKISLLSIENRRLQLP